MHIRVKRDILKVVALMQQLQGDLSKNLTEQNTILESCQQAAIAIGDKIEKSLVEDKEIIPMLEAYCELVYQISQCFDETRKYSEIIKLDNLLDNIVNHINDLPEQYRVVFLPYKADMWDSLESIWQACNDDPRCECDVVPIPYFEANRIENQWDTRYDSDRFPSYVPITHFDYYHLDEMQPDIIYIHNPYDDCNHVTTVHPVFYSKELRTYTNHLVYVPYYVNGGHLYDDKRLLPSCYYVHHMFFQSAMMKEECKDMPYYEKIQALGSPKFDSIILRAKQGVVMPKGWNEIILEKKTIMLNTTLNDLLGNNEKLLAKLKSFFIYAKNKDNIAIIWRPHPLLEGTVKAMRPELYNQYLTLVDYFVSEKVGILDKGGNLSDSIILSDAYIGSEYSSIINLFTVANKPIFLMNSKETIRRTSELLGDRKKYFNSSQETGYYYTSERADYTIEDFIDDLATGALDCIKEEQMKFASTVAENLDGTCGQKIHEYMMELVKKDYDK